MSLENSEKQELNTNKPNKISLSDEDKEFIQILRLVYPRVSRKTPSWVKKNVMDAYAKEYHYRILWRTIKTKIVEYKEALFGTKGGLEIALASTVVLFILSGIVYYQYVKPENSPTNIIANHETPIVKVSPNATYAPIVTPSPIESIDTKIVKSSNSGENNQALTPKTSVKLRKPEEPKNLYKERDKIADNTRNGNHTNITSNRAIKTVYIGYLGEIEEVEGIDILLKSALKDHGFELFNSENIGIDKADVAITTIKEIDEEYIILTDKHDKIFFKRKTAELVGKSTEEKTTLIIEELERYKSGLKSRK